MTVRELLAELRQRNVKLIAEDDRLRFGPKHLVTPDMRATLVEHKQELLALLAEDDAAVKAGVTFPWSSGPVEGHINRLKMLKRQMFGRARLDLLSRRFVLAPRGGQAQAPGPRGLPCAPAEPVAA